MSFGLGLGLPGRRDAAVLGGGDAPTSVLFDGSTDYYKRTGDHTGNVDSKLGIMGGWFKRSDTTDGVHIVGSTGDTYRVWVTGNVLELRFSSIVPALSLRLRSSVTVPYTTWHHFAYAWDTADAGKTRLRLDGVSRLTSTTFVTDAVLDWTQSIHAAGSRSNGLGKWKGELAELYLATGQWLDLDDADELAKFIVDGKPVYLGADGGLPTGVPALVYKGGGFLAGINSGSGDDYTVNGTPVAGSPVILP